MTVATIDPKELHSKLQHNQNIDLFDVRTPVEFREVHATVAKNLPLDQLNPQQVLQQRNGHSDQPIYLICRSGSRGKMACEKFQSVGFQNVVNVEGGTQAWEQAGLPVVRGKKAMSLERQVRIAAGSLVLLGVLLSLVSPWFLIISGFVGAGLVFAGVTDTCGMGMMLAKMPWNQVKQECTTNKEACPS